MFNLNGKIALVTGASGAIGRAIATALHTQGATVALSGTRVEALQSLAAELGDRTLAAPADLTDAASIEKLIAKTESELGGIDILVNNAGLTRDTLILRMKDEDWQTVLDVNLTAVFRLCRASVKGMLKRRSGRIINISSIVGVTGNPGQTNYAASKAGLIGFTKSLAQEVAGRGITVNALAPGFITTPMTEGLNETQRDRFLAAIPLRRFGAAEEIAAAAVYLASQEAGYITGQTLHINGGMAMI